MKILIRQFLGKNHSWAHTGWGLATALKQLGHEVHLFSTDGTKHLPSSLRSNLIGYTEEDRPQVFGRLPDKEYDCQFSYTCMKNFPYYLNSGTKNRFGMWIYEWSGKNSLPTGFAKHYQSCDYLCSPSNFGKRVFMDSGIPENVIKVIPHGINVDNYRKTNTIKLPTDKAFKLFSNIAQLHRRKNIPGLLEAYGKAFTDKDDVCLILKAKEKPITMPMEVSLNDCLKSFYNKFPKHAEVKVFSEFVEDISSLYRSVDAVFTMSFCEGFYYPALEAMASGKLSIAPNWGGQLDLLDETNALLIEGGEERADPKSMYWASKNDALWFRPNIDDAVDKLRFAQQNYQEKNKKIDSQREDVYDTYSWKTVAGKIINLCQ